MAKVVLRGFNGSPFELPATSGISFCAPRARNGTTLLTMLLPSGRRLYYRNARLVTIPGDRRESIVYEGVDTYKKKWMDIRTWGSKLAENATQAAARDVIIEAGLRVDHKGLGDLVLSVHDELVFEVLDGSAKKLSPEIKREIDARPAWAPDLPVASEGAIQYRYGK